MTSINEREVTINGEVSLKGTLTWPEGVSSGAILFLHGSGPTDRNENVKGLPINAFQDLAEDITSIGFTTLRYDKRGIGQSGGSYIRTGFWDLVNDAEAAVNFLKNDPSVKADKIILLGHSEGCIIAPALNSRLEVQGLILLAGTAESLRETVLRQGELAFDAIKQMGGFKGWLLGLLKAAEKGKAAQKNTFEKIMASSEDVIKIRLQKVNAKWIREHFSYNVAADLEKVTCPTLAITGDKDVQVLPEDAARIAQLVKGPSEYHIIRDMNHLLRKQAGPASMTNLRKNYKAAVKEPVNQEVINIVLNWLVETYGIKEG